MSTEEKGDASVLFPLAAAVFLIFFNGYMVAPLIPALAIEFGVGVQEMGWVVPAYMLTYGASTLVYGPLSDRLGRGRVLLSLLSLFVLVTIAAPFVRSFEALVAVRILSGLTAGGVLPIALALVGDLYPYEKVGRPMGWLFGAVAGGAAFGSTFGAWLNPTIGWRRELVGLAIANAVVFAVLVASRRALGGRPEVRRTVGEVVAGYGAILGRRRALSVYALVLLNAIFHGGVFSWLGYYLAERYHFDDVGVGRTLLGYGLPGMFLGPAIGRLADRYGRRRIIPFGFVIAGMSALALSPTSPVPLVVVAVTLLSVGFDMSHPLMAGVVTSLDPPRRGQAMGLGAFSVFVGFGLGSIAFQLAMRSGLTAALAIFGASQLALAIAATRVFGTELAAPRPTATLRPRSGSHLGN